MSAVIFEGQVVPGYIKGVQGAAGKAGSYEPIRFKHKLLGPEARSKYVRNLRLAQAQQESDPDGEHEVTDFSLQLDLVVMLLTEWDLKYPEDWPAGQGGSPGQPVPVTAAAIENLHPNVFTRLSGIVSSLSVSDVDPELSGEDAERQKKFQKAGPKKLSDLLATEEAESVGN